MLKPPATKINSVTETIHGVSVTDPYRWLEDQQSPETRAWLVEQVAYTKAVLDAVPGREKIQNRIAGLMRIDSQSPIARRGGRFFYWKRKAEQNKAVLYMKRGERDEVLVDPNAMAADGSISVQFLDVSLDGTLLAYGIQTGGEDEATVRFLNTDTGQQLSDELPKTRLMGLSITKDKSEVYYSRHDENGPRLLRHKLGGAEEIIFGENFGQEISMGSGISEDGRWLILAVYRTFDTTDVYLKDLSHESDFQPIVEGVDARFNPSVGDDQLFLETNWNAPNGRVLATPVAHPTPKEQWTEIIPERKYALESTALIGGKLIASYLENASNRVVVINPDGTHFRDIPLPAIGTVSGLSGDWSSTELFYGFTSYNQPNAWFRYELNTGHQETWFKPNLPMDPAEFEVKQVWFTSKDGTEVPMFLFHKNGLKPDKNTPTLLYAYGGFNVNLTPGFSSQALAWAELGGIYAVANLRGGGEFGETWHEAGMREKKQNVFDDFTAAAEWLIGNNYTSPAKLAIEGGSNGGLLVGAALTQHPELYGAVICAVPLLDMIRYHMFKVAKFWVPEYGSSEDAAQFEYIYKYSPYHHVVQGKKYPAVMFVTGDSDTRVDPLHARKMAAWLQASSDKPVLLYYDTKSGHSGGKPLSQMIDDATNELLFLTSQLV